MMFRNVYVQKSIAGRTAARDILSRVRYRRKVLFASLPDLASGIGFRHAAAEQKRDMVLAENTGTFIKPCFRDRENIDPHEYFLTLFTGCGMDCQYCYLQDYLDLQVPVVYVNRRALFRQLSEFLSARNDHFLVHAGEVCDPFLMERIFPCLEKLIASFSNHPLGRLEIRSKTVPPRWFSRIRGVPNVIISATLSPDDHIAKYEKKTSPLLRRIQMLRQALDQGFSVAIRLDPVICSGDLAVLYRDLFNAVFSSVPPEKMDSVSVGALRFTKDLYRIVRHRFPDSDILSGELLPSSSEKIKYVLPLRRTMYRTIVSLLRDYMGNDMMTRVSFCMDKALEDEILGGL